MRKTFLTLVIILTMVACGNSSKNKNEEAKVEQTTEQTATVMSLDDMLASAEKLLDQEVTFKGYVTHTCVHSGRRCFMQGDNKVSVRVEAKGEIGGFNRELVGNEIAVTGTLKEKRLTANEINEMEKVIETKSIKNDGSEESCDTERANIQEMRDWMKANNKDYFAIYYVDGKKYNEL